MRKKRLLWIEGRNEFVHKNKAGGFSCRSFVEKGERDKSRKKVVDKWEVVCYTDQAVSSGRAQGAALKKSFEKAKNNA